MSAQETFKRAKSAILLGLLSMAALALAPALAAAQAAQATSTIHGQVTDESRAAWGDATKMLPRRIISSGEERSRRDAIS